MHRPLPPSSPSLFPISLRALYGTDGTENATHGSDSPASAAREIKFFFPHLVSNSTAAPDYIATHIQPASSKALATLSHEKPLADKFEAVTFLTSYLLQNNSNKAKVLLPDEFNPGFMCKKTDDDKDFTSVQRIIGSGGVP